MNAEVLDLLRIALHRKIASSMRTQSGCLIASTGPDRYSGLSVQAHRVRMDAHVAVVWCRGETVPVGMVVRHSCDTKGCIESTHLAVGTQSQNVNESYERSRRKPGAWAVGEARPQAVMTEDQVVSMRRLARSGTPLQQVVARFGFSYSSTRMAVRGETWAHVTSEPAVAGRTNRLPNPHAYRFSRTDEARRASELKRLGLSLNEIAAQMSITRHTAWKLTQAAASP